MNLETRAEELASDLGVAKEEVKQDLENLVAYHVPVDEAIQSIRRKYGGNGDLPSEPAERDIASITTADGSVSVTVRLLTAGRRTIMYQGSEHEITEGTVADQTGKIDYTAWTPIDVSPGDTISIQNATVREWNGRPELNIGDGTDVSPVSTPLEVPYEIGGERTLETVEPGDRGLTVEVHVLEVEHRTIDGRAGETEILSGILGDQTARLPFTDWDPHDAVREGVSLRLSDVYVREFRGVPSINLSSFTTVEEVAEPVSVAEGAPRQTLEAAIGTGGMFDVELVGTIVDIRDGSGLIQRCPECRRVIQRGECRSHGEVDPIDDLRIKAILDDGTATATAIFGTEQTVVLYGGDVAAAKEHAREAMDQAVITEAIADEIVGRFVRLRGALSVDDYGANVDVRSFEEWTEDPVEQARSLLAEVAG